MTMTLVETIEVGAGGAASIEFTSIPQDGTDLLCVVSARINDASPFNALITFNNDSGSNYGYTDLSANGLSITSSRGTLSFGRFVVDNSDDTANTFGNSSIYVANYTSTTNKSISHDGINENNASIAIRNLAAMSYSTTSAISSIELATLSPDLFVQYTTASLYIIS